MNEETVTAFKTAFSGDVGRVVLTHLARITGFGGTAFAADAIQTAYNCGRQDVFRDIMRVLEMDATELNSLKQYRNMIDD